MTAKQITEPQIARFWRSMEEQGVTVTRTKKGLMLRLPDGETTVKHFTESDVRAQANLIARLRRAGVVHPDDPRGPSKLPSYITSPTPKQKTLDRAREVIDKMGYPSRVATSDLYDAFNVQDAPRMLYFLGYTPSAIRGARGMRLWDAPEELDKRFRDQQKPVEAVEVEPKPIEQTPTPLEVMSKDIDDELRAMANGDAPKEEPSEPDVEVKHENGRDFIDDTNSWLVTEEDTPKAVQKYLRGLRAAGLSAEIRVWVAQ